MHIPVQGLVDGSMKPVQFPLIVRKSPVAADMALLMWRPDHGFDTVKISLAFWWDPFPLAPDCDPNLIINLVGKKACRVCFQSIPQRDLGFVKVIFCF